MRTDLRTLTEDECLDRLRRHRVGRIAVTHRALPAIVPVNYVVDGHAVVFRTRGDGILADACRSTVVAFEVDDVDPDGLAGHSVLVVGVADVLDPSERLRALSLELASPVADPDDQFVRITIGTVTGREVTPAGAPVAAAAR